MKFLRTIRFDGSDDHVFQVAAQPDEWAVSGTFAFWHLGAGNLTGKTRQAFANGFLGLESLGRSTFASVAGASETEIALITSKLAKKLRNSFGAPDEDSALAAAHEEVHFVTELCNDAVTNTVFTVRRRMDENGEIREEFRKIRPPTGEPMHTPIWRVVDDEH